LAIGVSAVLGTTSSHSAGNTWGMCGFTKPTPSQKGCLGESWEALRRASLAVASAWQVQARARQPRGRRRQ
jgi:hypothetical protein